MPVCRDFNPSLSDWNILVVVRILEFYDVTQLLGKKFIFIGEGKKRSFHWGVNSLFVRKPALQKIDKLGDYSVYAQIGVF